MTTTLSKEETQTANRANQILDLGNFNSVIISPNWEPIDRLLVEFSACAQTLRAEWLQMCGTELPRRDALYQDWQLYEAFTNPCTNVLDAPAWVEYERSRTIHLLNLLIAD